MSKSHSFAGLGGSEQTSFLPRGRQSLDQVRFNRQQISSSNRKSDPTGLILTPTLLHYSPASPLSANFYTPNLEVAEEEDRNSNDLQSVFHIHTIDTQAEDDLALTFHPTSKQGLGIDFSSQANTPQDASDDRNYFTPIYDLQALSSVASRRGKRVPNLQTTRGTDETQRPTNPKLPNRKSSLRKDVDSMVMPDTPLKRAPSREEDTQNMARLDLIESDVQLGKGKKRAISPSVQYNQADERATSPLSFKAGPSTKFPSKEVDLKAGRTSRNSNYEFVKGPQGFKRSSRASEDLVSLQSPPTRILQVISPNSEGMHLEEGGLDFDESVASGFAYLPNGQEKPSQEAIQHLNEQILSQNDFYRAVSAMQFDPPLQRRPDEEEQYGGQIRKRWKSLITFPLLTLIFITLFCVFEAPYLWFAINPAVVIVASYLFLMIIVSFIITASTNPGRIPKHLDVDPVTAASLGHERQSFVLPDVHQLDEDSPRRQLALSKIRQQIKGFIPRSPPAKEKEVEQQRRVSIVTPSPIPLRPSIALVNQGDGEGGARNQPSGDLNPISIRERVRVIPLTDSAGRKTWLVYNGSESDVLSPRKKMFAFASFRKKKKNNNTDSRPRQTIDLEKQIVPRQVDVNLLSVQLRWCTHCQSFPSPRAFHCRKCGHCCQNFHYHCSWVNNDIGGGNLSIFIGLLASSLVTCIYVVIFAALHLYQLARKRDTDGQATFPGIHLPGIVHYTGSFRNAVAGSPTTVIIFLLGMIGMLFFASRLSLHLWCAGQAQTVMQRRLRKDIAKRFHINRPLNPFDTGSVARNMSQSLLQSYDYSLTSFRRPHQNHHRR